MARKFRWRGLDDFFRNVEASFDDTLHALEGATFEKANTIMTDSKKLVPVDTGALKNSGFAENPVVSGKLVTVKIGFGGVAVPYAIKVHEDLTAHHTVGQAKYLEEPLNEHKRTMEEDLARKVRGRLFRNRG